MEGSLKYNGKVVENNTFVMPNEDVVIQAQFENLDEKLLAEAKEAALKKLDEVDLSGLTEEQQALADDLLTQTRTEISNATSVDYIDIVLSQFDDAMDWIRAWVCAGDHFLDVKKDSWYHESVDILFNIDVMAGVSGNVFGVYDSLTRAQMVSILYRLEGRPSVEGLTHPFTDVPAGSYYEKAVIWAYNQGIIYGTSDTVFDPYGTISRMQLATILYRNEGSISVEEDYLSAYPDHAEVSKYARDAMNWAVAYKLIYGVAKDDSTTLLAPRQDTSRVQAAAIICRYLTPAENG